MIHALFFSLLVLLAGPCWSETLFGAVIGVSDGDTITVLDSANLQHKIRLSGIDAPEKHQPFSARSKENLSRLVFGQKVIIEWHKRDRYKRMVGRVLVNGQDVNLEQIRAGMAWHFKRYKGEQPSMERIGYASAENEARAVQRGLWRDPHPVAPWEYRRLGDARPGRPLR
jgi:endonuclease YncB( thermonuclease family)